MPFSCWELTSLCISQSFALLDCGHETGTFVAYVVTVIPLQWNITQKTRMMRVLVSSTQHCWCGARCTSVS